MGYWFAAYVPRGTPAPVVARLNELLHAGVKGAAAKAFFETVSSEPWTTTPDELARFQATETTKWGRSTAGIRPTRALGCIERQFKTVCSQSALAAERQPPPEPAFRRPPRRPTAVHPKLSHIAESAEHRTLGQGGVLRQRQLPQASGGKSRCTGVRRLTDSDNHPALRRRTCWRHTRALLDTSTDCG